MQFSLRVIFSNPFHLLTGLRLRLWCGDFGQWLWATADHPRGQTWKHSSWLCWLLTAGWTGKAHVLRRYQTYWQEFWLLRSLFSFVVFIFLIIWKVNFLAKFIDRKLFYHIWELCILFAPVVFFVTSFNFLFWRLKLWETSPLKYRYLCNRSTDKRSASKNLFIDLKRSCFHGPNKRPVVKFKPVPEVCGWLSSQGEKTTKISPQQF